MIITKLKSIVDSQKIKRRESNHIITENHQFTKEGTREEERKKYKTIGK